jgi:hypothetical protein
MERIAKGLKPYIKFVESKKCALYNLPLCTAFSFLPILYLLDFQLSDGTTFERAMEMW